MRIHDFPYAPNPRKLRIYLAEKGIQIPFVMVNILQGEHRQPTFLSRNPMGGVPMLELDDGECLSESLAIIEFIEELHPEPPMIGRTPIERARVRRLERIAEMGVLSRAARYVHASRSPLPDVKGDPAVAAQMLEELSLPLGVLDAEAAERPFVAGEQPTIADCTLYAAAAFAKFAELDLLAGHPNLRAWFERFSERPSVQNGG
jgi:glutathione S-transferase